MIKVRSGKSEKDRISFSTKTNTVTAIRKENGDIFLDFKNQNESFGQALLVLLGIFGTLSLIKAFVLVPLIENHIIQTTWYLVPSFCYLFLIIFSIIVVRKSGGKELLRNHGAEHMVFSAYNKLKKVPTVEEARHFSRINRACGATIFSAFMTAQLIGFIVYLLTGFVISELILFLVPLFFQTIFPFNFLGKVAQFFTTSKPEKQNIELAIFALLSLERRESI